jgi:hypothetical protein
LLAPAVDKYFKRHYGLPEDYQPGRPIPRIAWEQTQFVTDALKDLKSDPTQINIDALGRGEYPDDYIHVSSAYYYYYKNAADCEDGEPLRVQIPVDWIRDEDINFKLSDPIAPPTKKYPCAVQYKTFFQVYPSGIDIIYLTYLKYPAKPQFAYTIDANTDEIIPGVSTDIDLPQNHFIDIATYVLDFIGINLRDRELSNYVQMLKAQGI